MVNSYIIYSQWSAMANNLPNRKQTPVSHLLFRTHVTDGLVNNSVQCQLGPVPGPTPPRQQFVRWKGHKSVNLAAHGLKPNRHCAECSLGVHETVCKETRFGCVTCDKCLCRDKCHDLYYQRFFGLASNDQVRQHVFYITFLNVCDCFARSVSCLSVYTHDLKPQNRVDRLP